MVPKAETKEGKDKEAEGDNNRPICPFSSLNKREWGYVAADLDCPC